MLKIFTILFCMLAPVPAWSQNSMDTLFKIIDISELHIIKEIKRAPPEIRNELLCLSLNIYHEARGSTDNDQWAVGLVTLNRLSNPEWGDSICKVVWERSKIGKKTIGQFSWTTLPLKLIIPTELKIWVKIQRVAYLMYTDPNIYDFTQGATHFYAPNRVEKPVWAINPTFSIIIGLHEYVKI